MEVDDGLGHVERKVCLLDGVCKFESYLDFGMEIFSDLEGNGQ